MATWALVWLTGGMAVATFLYATVTLLMLFQHRRQGLDALRPVVLARWTYDDSDSATPRLRLVVANHGPGPALRVVVDMQASDRRGTEWKPQEYISSLESGGRVEQEWSPGIARNLVSEYGMTHATCTDVYGRTYAAGPVRMSDGAELFLEPITRDIRVRSSRSKQDASGGVENSA